MKECINETIMEKYEFRNIRPEETDQEEKVEMYRKMGFKDLGISASVWGGEEWHDMSYTL